MDIGTYEDRRYMAGHLEALAASLRSANLGIVRVDWASIARLGEEIRVSADKNLEKESKR